MKDRIEDLDDTYDNTKDMGASSDDVEDDNKYHTSQDKTDDTTFGTDQINGIKNVIKNNITKHASRIDDKTINTKFKSNTRTRCRKRNYKEDSDNEKKIFQCDKCKDSFKSNELLKGHTKYIQILVK